MSTRGAIGFRKDGVDKVTYNHSDSYPDWLLRKVVEFASQHTDLALNNMFDRIELVNEGDVPTPDQIEVYNKYSNTNVGIQSSESWYCLLRETQGDLEVYSLLGGCTHMIDSHEFLSDSLFCEWAYIINLDLHCLEIYKGFNEDPKAAGRYAKVKDSRNNYQGVALIKAIDLDDIRRSDGLQGSLDKLIEELEAL